MARRLKKTYEKPRTIWDRARIEEDKKLMETYGLRRKRELWKIETILRNKRKQARKLLVGDPETMQKRKAELIGSLNRLGILSKDASTDDVLGLGVEDFLERRLQTLVWRKGLANSINQARQFIVHRHIAIGERVISSPGHIVSREEEEKIRYRKKPLIIERAFPAKEEKTRLRKTKKTEEREE